HVHVSDNCRSPRSGAPQRMDAEIPADTQRLLVSPHAGPGATVRDGSRSTASAGRSRHSDLSRRQGERGGDAHWQAYQQPRFAESDVRHSRLMTRNTLTCWKQAFFVVAWFVRSASTPRKAPGYTAWTLHNAVRHYTPRDSM